MFKLRFSLKSVEIRYYAEGVARDFTRCVELSESNEQGEFTLTTRDWNAPAITAPLRDASIVADFAPRPLRPWLQGILVLESRWPDGHALSNLSVPHLRILNVFDEVNTTGRYLLRGTNLKDQFVPVRPDTTVHGRKRVIE
jgi:hypothetical protein